MVPLCFCCLHTIRTVKLWHSACLIAECKHHKAIKADCVQYVSERFGDIVLWCDGLTHGAVVFLLPAHNTYREAVAQRHHAAEGHTSRGKAH